MGKCDVWDVKLAVLVGALMLGIILPQKMQERCETASASEQHMCEKAKR